MVSQGTPTSCLIRVTGDDECPRYNNELFDPYENHVSLHTRGWRHANSAEHSYSLGHSASVPNLLNSDAKYSPTEGEVLDGGVHTAKVVYSPVLDPSVLSSGKFSFGPVPRTFWVGATGTPPPNHRRRRSVRPSICGHLARTASITPVGWP